MHDRLLYYKEITVPFIQKKVSEEMAVELSDMTSTNKQKDARKREKVSARQLSMALSKKYTKLSLGRIGSYHGGRDHATVLHAVRTVSNLVDTNDELVAPAFYKLDEMLNSIKKKTADPYLHKIYYAKQDVIKTFIRTKIPLEQRMIILKELNFYTYERYTMAPVSNRMQKRY